MLPSVDSLLACRVILLLISTARPVSVLLWMVLRNFLPPASAHTVTHDANDREGERRPSVSELGRESCSETHTNAFTGSYRNRSNKAHLTEFPVISTPGCCCLFKKLGILKALCVSVRNTKYSPLRLCATDCLWGSSGSKFTYKHPAPPTILADPRRQLTPPIKPPAAHLHLTACMWYHVGAPVADRHISTQKYSMKALPLDTCTHTHTHNHHHKQKLPFTSSESSRHTEKLFRRLK